MSVHPYDWAQARERIELHSRRQQRAEEEIREAYAEYGEAERRYRLALAAEILRLKADGVAITVAQDLAKGTPGVADLRFARDVAEGVREAAKSAIFRHTANRRELEQLVSWSMRVSPDGQFDPVVRAAA